MGNNEKAVEIRYEDENIWLTQRMLATIYDVEPNTINYHIKIIYNDMELLEESTTRKFRIVQKEGKREVKREVIHYNLQIIIAVGFKVNNERAVQFRKWANNIVKEYTIKGWVLDDERLKNNGSILTEEYFEKLLERIREIRLSERFFKTVQNKIHYAIHGQTAAEVIYNRANAKKENMGLTNWNVCPI